MAPRRQRKLGKLFLSFYEEESRHNKYHGVDPFEIDIEETLKVDLAKLKISGGFEDGGYSRVYKGSYNEGEVAIKLIENDDNSTREEKQRNVKREIEIMSQMKDENIVKFIGASVLEICCIIVMEYVNGHMLDEYVEAQVEYNQWDLAQSLNIALDIAKALCYVHSKSIVHGDLKPANLLISGEKVVKLIDFGLAHDYTSEEFRGIVFDAGTKEYMAPELLEKKQYDQKIDVYSFSVILYWLLTGEKPFESTSMEAIMDAVLEGKRPSLDKIPGQISSEIIPLLEDCWANDPQNRPEFTEVKDRLDEIIQSIY